MVKVAILHEGNAPFDFSHSNFDELKTKLKKLFEEEI